VKTSGWKASVCSILFNRRDGMDVLVCVSSLVDFHLPVEYMHVEYFVISR
jgi:hypothetical protein